MLKKGQSGEFSGRHVGPLLKTGLYEGIPKSIHCSGMTTLVITNEEINNIMEILKSLENSGLIIKKVLAKQFKTKLKNKKVYFSTCY